MQKPIQRKHSRSIPPLDPSGQQGVLSQKAFWFVLKKERDRADRSGHQFSLLELSLPVQRGKCQDKWILNVLARRIRITDVIGWLGPSTLGVFLADTPAEGAAAFVNRITPPISDTGSMPAVQIYTYPSDESESVHFPDSNQFFAEKLAVKPALPIALMERFAAGLALIVLSPVFLVIAAIIKMSSPGPVFFRQERVGYKGQTFYCNKFRTMRLHSETETHEEYFSYLMETPVPMKKLDSSGDSRIFPAGHLLRASSLDELPQLINIFRGEMRLIGPRPCTPHEYEQYFPWHRHRTGALPGLTGLWQVSGKNKTTFTEMIRLDLRYIQQRSILRDFLIVLKTVPVVITQFFEDRVLKKNGGDGLEASLNDAPFLNAANSSRSTDKSESSQK